MKVFIVENVWGEDRIVFSTLDFAESWIAAQHDPKAWFVNDVEVMK